VHITIRKGTVVPQHEDERGVEVELHAFLTSALDEVRSQLHAPATFVSSSH
jgi:hypothetical protein